MAPRGGYGYINTVGRMPSLDGAEFSLDAEIVPRFQAQVRTSYVRGTLADSESPLERIPPLNGKVALRYVTQPLKSSFHSAIFRWTTPTRRI